jgi:hypothetical protein
MFGSLVPWYLTAPKDSSRLGKTTKLFPNLPPKPAFICIAYFHVRILDSQMHIEEMTKMYLVVLVKSEADG